MRDLPEKLIGGVWFVDGEAFGADYLRHVVSMVYTGVSFPKTRKADRALTLLKRSGVVRFDPAARKWEVV
jgi:hypothetical protein